LRLDLDDADDAAPAPPPGVTLTTLAAERARDPACLEKLHELAGRVADDPVRPPPFDEREARLWLDRPCVFPDGYFIAVEDGGYVGLCSVNVCDAAPGQARHGTTGVVPERRRRGIGMALKRAAIHFARGKGYRAIRTSNRPSQPAILALNERLGYTRRYASISLERCLRDVARLDPALYDAYVGRYAAPPGPTVLVTKEAGRLFAAFLGQKVELFPESERSFFIKWFHGTVEFEGDAKRLVWRHREPRGKEVVVCAARVG
jgi:GNAT superfamily N-acetyltransferase